MLLNFCNLDYSYDGKVDVLYCKSNQPYIYDYTIPVTQIFNIDISETRRVVAFELLDASKLLQIPNPRELMFTPKIKFTVQVTKDVIKVTCNIQTMDGSIGGFNVKALNDNDACPGVYYYYT